MLRVQANCAVRSRRRCFESSPTALRIQAGGALSGRQRCCEGPAELLHAAAAALLRGAGRVASSGRRGRCEVEEAALLRGKLNYNPTFSLEPHRAGHILSMP